jgi:hypothetical protein
VVERHCVNARSRGLARRKVRVRRAHAVFAERNSSCARVRVGSIDLRKIYVSLDHYIAFRLSTGMWRVHEFLAMIWNGPVYHYVGRVLDLSQKVGTPIDDHAHGICMCVSGFNPSKVLRTELARKSFMMNE